MNRSLVLSCVAAVLVLGTVAFFLHAHASTQEQESAADGELRRSCSTTGFYIKASSSGYYLTAGTTSGSTLSYTNPSSISSSSSIPQFSIVQAGNTTGNQETYYIRTSSGMYLYLATTSTSSMSGSNALTVQSTGSPNSRMRWIISLAPGYSYSSCNPKFNIAPYSYSNYYIQGGVWYPALSTSRSSFTIETFGGDHPCGTATRSCVTKYCKTGISVAWSNSTSVQNAAQTTCNNHCLSCSSYDYNCKSCGGTIDTYNDATTTNGQQYRQCDCNSALQTASFSFASILMAFIAMKLQG